MRIVFVENIKTGKIHPHQLPDGRVPGGDCFRKIAVNGHVQLKELDDSDLIDLYWSMGFTEEPEDQLFAAKAIWEKAKTTSAIYYGVHETGDDTMARAPRSAAKKAAKKAAPKKVKAEKAEGSSGRPSTYAGQKIYIKTEGKKNPRREGTHGHTSFGLIKDGMTYEAYIEAGGRSNDLRWDIEKGNVELR